MKPSFYALRQFIHHEAASGVLLLLAALAALLCANSGVAEHYQRFLEFPLSVGAGEFVLSKTVSHWINDGLMVIFFLLIGLEIKREVLEGELSNPRQAALPIVAAMGGMLCPALIYAYFNWGDALAMRGWAIPSATDIAFSLGVLALLGSRVPFALKVFLTTVAVADDLGAIVIIALFYTNELYLESFALAAAGLAALALLNRREVKLLTPYMLIGVVVWLAVLKSGVHATIAGVLIAFCIPHHGRAALLKPLVRALHPWVAYAILPLFAFANAGVSFAGLSPGNLLQPVPLGIALGLFFGKQFGIAGTSWLLIRSGAASLPSGANWRQFYGVCLLCGIGFTMSLFIGALAFHGGLHDTEVRLGVLTGSFISAVVGYAWLRLPHTR